MLNIFLYSFFKKVLLFYKNQSWKNLEYWKHVLHSAAVGRVTANLTSDVTVYNSTREEKHDRRSQPKHVTNFMADG